MAIKMTKKEVAPKKTKKVVASEKTAEQKDIVSEQGQKKHNTKRIVLAGVLFGVVAVVWYQFGICFFEATFNRQEQRVQKPAITNDMVVAEVNGKPIQMKDVRVFVEGVPQLAELPLEMVYPQILDTMINTQVLLTAAQKSGVDKEPNVQKAIQMAKEQLISQAYLTKQLEKQMTPDVLQALYLEEMKGFERQDEIRARHILVDSEQNAKDIIVQLNAGADFAKLANEKSLDKDNKDGELGYFTQNMMIPEFGTAVFALKKGQLSNPIKTPFGWHVVYVEDRRLAAPPAFEEVQDQLKRIYAERHIKDVLQQERTNANVKVLKPQM